MGQKKKRECNKEGENMAKPKPDHRNTVCCICESRNTYIKPDRESDWRRYKNNRGIWDGKSYQCYNCYFNIGKLRVSKHENTKCCICGSKDTYVRSDGNPHWLKDYDNNGKETGKYLCMTCYEKSPDSRNGTIKGIAHIRTGQLGVYTQVGEGIIGEVAVMKVRNLKNCNIEYNNFNSRFDLFLDPEYDIIQVKTTISRYGDWNVKFGDENNFDYIFALCLDRRMRDVERLYAIPEEELYRNKSIKITKNGLKWRNFRIEEKPYNDAFHGFMSFLNGRNFFGIDDIKKWLEA